MKNKTFVFTTQNPKASRYLLICLISFVAISGMSFLPVVVLIVLVFGSMILGFVLFNRHSKILEKITLYEDHLNSEVFGLVYYKSIISAKPVTIDTGEGLRLKLKNKKKVWWKALKTEELPLYNEFVSALSEAVDDVDLSEAKGKLSKTYHEPEVPEDSSEITVVEGSQPLGTKMSVGKEIVRCSIKIKMLETSKRFC